MAVDPITMMLLGTSLVGGVTRNRSQRSEGKAQRTWQEDMWNKQNAYNTPAMQMERLKKAGLNPALMYGQGNVGNAEKAGSYQQPQIENVGPSIAQAAASGSQLSLVNEQKNHLRAQALKQLAGVNLDKANTWRLNSTTGQLLENMKSEGNLLVQQTKESVSRTSYNDMLTLKAKYDIKLTQAQTVSAQYTAQKIKNDTILQGRLIKEMEKGYGSGTLQTIGNLLGIDNIDSPEARKKAFLSMLAVTPMGRGASAIAKGVGKFGKAVYKYFKNSPLGFIK